MKKGISFILGIVVGIALTMGVLFTMRLLHKSSPKLMDGLTLLQSPGETMKIKNFRVLQVVTKDSAISLTDDAIPALLLTKPEDNIVLYDDLIIKVPAGKCVKCVGTYYYETKQEIMKTIPAVALFDKQ